MRRFGMEPVWTSEDTRNAIMASLIPGATAFTAFAVFANDRNVVDWWTHAKKPDWAPKNPMVYSVVDIATLSPLGYASYLVYRNGGGFQYSDTKLALGLYGLNMIFALTTVPLIKKRSFTSSRSGCSVMHFSDIESFVERRYAAWSSALSAFMTRHLHTFPFPFGWVSLFRNTVLLNVTAIGAAYAFYKVDKTAGYLLLPYAVWTGFYAFLTYSMSKENASEH